MVVAAAGLGAWTAVRSPHRAVTASHATTTTSSTTTSVPSTTTTQPSPGPTVPTVPAPCTPTVVPGGAYAVGDSVMLDAQQALQGCVPNLQVNAAVSRQWSDGEAIVREVMSGAEPPSVVVVDLGTNGPITDSDFDAMMAAVHGAGHVVFVTVHVDRPWQDQVNGVLASGVARYPRAVLADWQSLAARYPEWFYSDGTHLPIGGPGAHALAWLIASKV